MANLQALTCRLGQAIKRPFLSENASFYSLGDQKLGEG
jgi:hypothetical protein